MSRGLYLALLRLAGLWASEPQFERVEIRYGCDFRATKAVYAAFDALGRPDYVGSVCRPGDRIALSNRVREHTTGRHEGSGWVYLHVFPLLPNAPKEAVRATEGRIGRVLTPSRNRRLPGGLAPAEGLAKRTLP